MPNSVENLFVCVAKEKRMEMQLAETKCERKCEWKWQKTQVKCAETKILIANARWVREREGESRKQKERGGEREEEEAEICA